MVAKVTNEDLWKRTNQIPITQEIKKRSDRKGRTKINCQAIQLITKGKWRRGRSTLICRKVLEKEIAEKEHNWNTIYQLSKDKEN